MFDCAQQIMLGVVLKKHYNRSHGRRGADQNQEIQNEHQRRNDPEQVVAIVGEVAVDKVERENCDFTSRVLMRWRHPHRICGSVRCEDRGGNEVA